MQVTSKGWDMKKWDFDLKILFGCKSIWNVQVSLKCASLNICLMLN